MDMAEQPKDAADRMPVNTEAGRKVSPPSGPVPTSETVEARNKRMAEERGVDEEDAEYVLPTPSEAFAERHPAAVRRHARMMDRMLDEQRGVHGPGEAPQTLRTMDQPKDNSNFTKTEHAIANNQRLTTAATHEMLGDQTRLAEMERAYGDYPGRTFTVDPNDVNEVKSMAVRPPGEPDVVTAFPQGLSSRHAPESRPR